MPVTLVTGFLGAGKTTLVKHVLTHGFRVAVILNDVGAETGIETAFIQDAKGSAEVVEEWVELANGCLCCSVKDSFLAALEGLVAKRDKFDHVLIETTGLANPGPIAAALWVDEELEVGLYLDAIVTVVDGRNIGRQLRAAPQQQEAAQLPSASSSGGGPAPATAAAAVGITPSSQPTQQSLGHAAAAGSPSATATAAAADSGGASVNEAQLQIAYANVVLLNKIDLLSAAQIVDAEASVRAINSTASIHHTTRSEVDMDKIFGQRQYLLGDNDAAVNGSSSDQAVAAAEQQRQRQQQAAQWLEWPAHADSEAHAANAHDAEPCTEACSRSDHRHNHHQPPQAQHQQEHSLSSALHQSGIATVTLKRSGELNLTRFKEWIEGLIWERRDKVGEEIYRMKGLLNVAGSCRMHMFQAVFELYDVVVGAPWGGEDDRSNKLVLIGRNLKRSELAARFQACFDDAATT